MSKEQQHPQHPYQTRGAQKRSSIAEQQQQKRERESQEQQMTAPKGQQQSFEQQIQQNNTKLQMKSSSAAASESEENNSGGSNNSTATSGYQQFLQKQNSMFSNTNSNNSQFSMYSSGAVARMDDEDPIFTLDEEVHAKAIERTRHYTADFDPTVSDDDEFQKDLHGGRAYSVSTRFPPRVRHSGRSGHPHQNTTGILHHHKLGGESIGSAAPPPIIPASLPIQISRGFQWPPRELVGSLSEEEETNLVTAEKCGGGLNLLERARARTTINPFSAGDIDTGEANVQQQKMGGGQNQNGSEREEQIGQQEGEDLYGRMQAYSRSIQPEDDPERIFGERPHRRYSISIKHVHPTVTEGANHNDGGTGELLLETSEELGGGEGGNDPHGEDSIGGENIPPGLMANINNNSSNIPTAANPMGIIGQPSTVGNGGGGNGTPRIIVPASLRG